MRRLQLRYSLISLAVIAYGIAWATTAQAAYGPFALVSGSPALHLQADYAYDAAISSNGAYVVYTGSIASAPGVYRTNLATGETELVALGADTGAPSISSNGSYVSFTTDDDPVTGEPSGECSAVYVRDMESPLSEASRPTLVSARNESTESLTYQASAGQDTTCGSAAAYRVAISGNGQEVAFTVLSPSDLTGQASQTETPADQVAVRFLKTDRTELVSVTRASLGGAGAPVPSGAALAGGSIARSVLPNGSPTSTSASTAAISADGNAVAWMGIDVQEQVELATLPPTGGHANGFAEPLWREITDGPAAPTRSVLAGGDASAQQCPPSCPGGLDLLFNEGVETSQDEGPSYGSFPSPRGFTATGTPVDSLDVITPQLSEDGSTVALLSTQPAYGEDPKYPPGEGTATTANAFVVNMAPGLTRAQSITRLTTWATLEMNRAALAGAIDEIAISPDGTQVAFTTERIAFPLAPPALVTPPLSQAAYNQLYEVNLPAGTTRLVSEGYNAQPAAGSVFDASLNENGSLVALASSANNLAFGTSNAGSDVFVTHELGSPAGPGQQIVSPLPGDPTATPPWRIDATFAHARNGDLLLEVSTPGAGSLTASATASVPVTPKSSRGNDASHARKTGHAASRAAIATRVVAKAKLTVKRDGLFELTLTPSPAYQSLAHSTGGLYASIEIAFSAVHQPRLTQKLQASFLASAPKRKTKRGSAKATAHDRARGR